MALAQQKKAKRRPSVRQSVESVRQSTDSSHPYQQKAPPSTRLSKTKIMNEVQRQVKDDFERQMV